SPQVDVRFALAEAEKEKLVATHPALRGKNVFAVTWTTTPWTLPANLALAFHPEADYAFFPVPGGDDVYLVAKAMRALVEERWWRGEKKLGEPLAEAKGAAFEG